MDNALAELEREYQAVTGRPLDEPHLDIFDLGLDSIAVLELITRVHDLGYPVRIDAFINADSMYEVARMMAQTRATQPDDVHGPAAGADRVAPRTEIERLIAGVWAEALGREEIGVHDDFFRLGGQSLQVARIINEIQQLTGLSLDLRAFFEVPTVAGLADHVVQQFAVVEEYPA